MDRCSVCENVVDTDDYPEGYYDAKDRARDKYICRWCDPGDDESETPKAAL